jgi:Gas vesicle synthesis protein GvpL/GvpF
MADKCVASAVQEPAHELDAGNVAFLIDTSREKDIEQVAGDLAEKWEGRVELRLLGPMAAYDFVGNIEPEAE